MSKIKRNEPCPCRSGKKYKKCCGVHAITGSNHNTINNELGRLHQEFISFATNKYNSQIKRQTELHYKSSLQDNGETVEIYNTGLIIWLLFHVPLISKSHTIFNEFYSSIKSKISQRTQQILSEWPMKAPSVYEVISINDPDKHFVTVKDIFKHKTYQIPFHDGDDFLKGSLIVGSLVPFAGHHIFFYTMIKLYRHDKSAIIQLFKEYSDEHSQLIKQFPNFLADVLALGVDQNERDSPLQEMVAQLFAEHMVDKDVKDEVILKGITLWNQYYIEEKPHVKKPEPYTAALEYLVQKTLLNDTVVTQALLAKEYETSSSTVSTIYRKLANVLGDKVNE